MNHDLLNRRRRELGMSISALSAHSGVPEATVKRVLGDGFQKVAFATVAAVARALGVTLSFEETVDAFALQEEQAMKKARCLIGIIQGSSGLESQAVEGQEVEALVQQTVHELMAGPKRKLWAT
ncbi:MAG: helix-turn-helix domain-containing protein [Pirellulales bacterium]|nr:helix-turn-helix domain-containing protein [Pirellulales bacterium]